MAGTLDPAVPEVAVHHVIADPPCRAVVSAHQRRAHGRLYVIVPMIRLGRLGRQVQIGKQRLLKNVAKSRKTHTRKADGPDLQGVQQQPAGHRHEGARFGGRVGQRRRSGERAHV